MITKQQLRIFGQFLRNVFAEYGYKELKTLSKEKSSDTFHSAIQKFKSEKIINEKSIGKSKLYSVNLSNQLSYSYLSIAAIEQLTAEPARALRELMQRIDQYTLFYSVIVFGSYADKTFTKESDLDVAILIPNKLKEASIKAAINTAARRSLLELDCHVITQEEFLEMLKVDYENLGKQIARKNLPVCNNTIFYKIIEEGIKNGFKY